MSSKLIITSFALLMTLVLGLFSLSFAPATYAQPGNRTPRPTRAIPTQGERSNDLAGTAAALATQRTGGNFQVEMQNTANALLTQIPVSGSEHPELLAATAEALATRASGFEAIQLTATALNAQLTGSFSPEAISTLVNNGTVVYDPNAQTLTVTYALSETSLNAVLATAITSSGYEIYSITTDLVPGGAILTTLTPEGTSVVIMSIYLLEGSVYLDITAATLNNTSVPVQALDNLETSFNQALDRLIATNLAQSNYTVTGVNVTETHLSLTVMILL